jgi:hypothetical protein
VPDGELGPDVSKWSCEEQRSVAFAARQRAREGKSRVFQASIACGKGDDMKLLYRRCAGLDIHKDSISVCIRIRNGGKAEAEIIEERFSTFTQELERLAEWLKKHKVRQVAMESTGVYFALSSALIGRVEVPPALR